MSEIKEKTEKVDFSDENEELKDVIKREMYEKVCNERDALKAENQKLINAVNKAIQMLQQSYTKELIDALGLGE